MAHECLVMGARPGPYMSFVGGASPILQVWPDWVVMLPAGSMYRGMALRFRASGTISTANPGFNFRPLPCWGATAPSVTQITQTVVFGAPVVTYQLGTYWFTADYTMVCRTVSSTLTTFMPGPALYTSRGIIGSTVTDGIETCVVNPPAVSTGAINVNIDNWFSFSVQFNSAALYGDAQYQNYRVDLIA